MRLEAVIFDMDGVVTRTTPLHVRAWTRLFDEYLDARRARGESHEPFDSVAGVSHLGGRQAALRRGAEPPRVPGHRDALRPPRGRDRRGEHLRAREPQGPLLRGDPERRGCPGLRVHRGADRAAARSRGSDRARDLEPARWPDHADGRHHRAVRRDRGRQHHPGPLPQGQAQPGPLSRSSARAGRGAGPHRGGRGRGLRGPGRGPRRLRQRHRHRPRAATARPSSAAAPTSWWRTSRS